MTIPERERCRCGLPVAKDGDQSHDGKCLWVLASKYGDANGHDAMDCAKRTITRLESSLASVTGERDALLTTLELAEAENLKMVAELARVVNESDEARAEAKQLRDFLSAHEWHLSDLEDWPLNDLLGEPIEPTDSTLPDPSSGGT